MAPSIVEYLTEVLPSAARLYNALFEQRLPGDPSTMNERQLMGLFYCLTGAWHVAMRYVLDPREQWRNMQRGFPNSRDGEEWDCEDGSARIAVAMSALQSYAARDSHDETIRALHAYLVRMVWGLVITELKPSGFHCAFVAIDAGVARRSVVDGLSLSEAARQESAPLRPVVLEPTALVQPWTADASEDPYGFTEPQQGWPSDAMDVQDLVHPVVHPRSPALYGYASVVSLVGPGARYPTCAFVVNEGREAVLGLSLDRLKQCGQDYKECRHVRLYPLSGEPALPRLVVEAEAELAKGWPPMVPMEPVEVAPVEVAQAGAAARPAGATPFLVHSRSLAAVVSALVRSVEGRGTDPLGVEERAAWLADHSVRLVPLNFGPGRELSLVYLPANFGHSLSTGGILEAMEVQQAGETAAARAGRILVDYAPDAGELLGDRGLAKLREDLESTIAERGEETTTRQAVLQGNPMPSFSAREPSVLQAALLEDESDDEEDDGPGASYGGPPVRADGTGLVPFFTYRDKVRRVSLPGWLVQDQEPEEGGAGAEGPFAITRGKLGGFPVLVLETMATESFWETMAGLAEVWRTRVFEQVLDARVSTDPRDEGRASLIMEDDPWRRSIPDWCNDVVAAYVSARVGIDNSVLYTSVAELLDGKVRAALVSTLRESSFSGGLQRMAALGYYTLHLRPGDLGVRPLVSDAYNGEVQRGEIRLSPEVRVLVPGGIHTMPTGTGKKGLSNNMSRVLVEIAVRQAEEYLDARVAHARELAGGASE